MFKKTPLLQTDLFKDLTSQLSDRKSAILDNKRSWHNIFFHEVTQRVNESVFEPLYEKNGRPNASLRVLMGMMILKEGNGWSDQQLFDSCRFDLRCMRALGLFNIDDDIPVESTYYEFRRRLFLHHSRYGEDLVSTAFSDATSDQIKAHNIKGEKIRMDSKLIQSNIAKGSRLELILETVRVSIVNINLEVLTSVLEAEDMDLLKSLKTKTTSNISYGMDNKRKADILQRLGVIIRELLPYCDKDGILARLYQEQYQEVTDNKDEDPDASRKSRPRIEPKKPNQIPSDSLQSPHDPEASFRCKGSGQGKKQVSGFHANLTETFNEENPFELITDVRTVRANICEDEFLAPSIEASNQVLDIEKEGKKTVVHVTTDGGYDSLENRKQMNSTQALHWNVAKHKGIKQRYHLSIDKDNNLTAYCKKLKKQCEVAISKKGNCYIIHHADGTKRYLKEDAVKNYLILQQQMESQDPEDIDIRPNVEATVHQVFHRLQKRDKIKYRGIFKCSLYCISRAYWANFRRILKNEEENYQILFSDHFTPIKLFLEQIRRLYSLRFSDIKLVA